MPSARNRPRNSTLSRETAKMFFLHGFTDRHLLGAGTLNVTEGTAENKAGLVLAFMDLSASDKNRL